MVQIAGPSEARSRRREDHRQTLRRRAAGDVTPAPSFRHADLGAGIHKSFVRRGWPGQARPRRFEDRAMRRAYAARLVGTIASLSESMAMKASIAASMRLTVKRSDVSSLMASVSLVFFAGFGIRIVLNSPMGSIRWSCCTGALSRIDDAIWILPGAAG